MVYLCRAPLNQLKIISKCALLFLFQIKRHVIFILHKIYSTKYTYTFRNSLNSQSISNCFSFCSTTLSFLGDFECSSPTRTYILFAVLHSRAGKNSNTKDSQLESFPSVSFVPKRHKNSLMLIFLTFSLKLRTQYNVNRDDIVNLVDDYSDC